MNNVQGYLAHKKFPPPLGLYHRNLGIVLLLGPKGARFLMSEVPMYVLARDGPYSAERQRLPFVHVRQMSLGCSRVFDAPCRMPQPPRNLRGDFSSP